MSSAFGQQPVSAPMDQYHLNHSQQHHHNNQHQNQHQHHDQQIGSSINFLDQDQHIQSYSSQESINFELANYSVNCRNCGYHSCKCLDHGLGMPSRQEGNFLVHVDSGPQQQQQQHQYQMTTHQSSSAMHGNDHIIEGSNLINLDLGYGHHRDEYSHEINNPTSSANIDHHHYLSTKQHDLSMILDHQQQGQVSSLRSSADELKNEIPTIAESQQQNRLVNEVGSNQFGYNYSADNDQQQQQQHQQQQHQNQQQQQQQPQQPWINQLIETKQNLYDQRLNQFDYYQKPNSHLDNNNLQDFNDNNNHQAQSYHYEGNKTTLIEHNSYMQLNKHHENNNDINVQNHNSIANKTNEEKFFYADNMIDSSDSIKYNSDQQTGINQKQANLDGSQTKRRQSFTTQDSSPSDQRYGNKLPAFNQLDRRPVSSNQLQSSHEIIAPEGATHYILHDTQIMEQDEQFDKTFTSPNVTGYQLNISPGEDGQSSQRLRSSKGRRGRPRKKGIRSKSKVNGKLWEFIRDLLLSERTNPSFIRWERREDGVFKFVQSDKVAKMWGERKQNPKMTYEKLSRAMRYV